jgi:serine/threonine protein phosphatase PrpC
MFPDTGFERSLLPHWEGSGKQSGFWFSGSPPFVVADGMGGHAGGDVASALAVQHLFGLDREYPTVDEAREALFHGILEAGERTDRQLRNTLN